MIFALLIALAAAPSECDPPQLRDGAPLGQLANLNGQLSDVLNAIATRCFDGTGTWSGGIVNRAKGPVDPGVPIEGECLKAVLACEQVHEALGNQPQLRKLEQGVLLDLERPYRGAKYQPRRSGLKDKLASTVSVDCQSKSRLDLAAMSNDRLKVERLTTQIQGEYADYKAWAAARAQQCRKELAAKLAAASAVEDAGVAAPPAPAQAAVEAEPASPSEPSEPTSPRPTPASPGADAGAADRPELTDVDAKPDYGRRRLVVTNNGPDPSVWGWEWVGGEGIAAHPTPLLVGQDGGATEAGVLGNAGVDAGAGPPDAGPLLAVKAAPPAPPVPINLPILVDGSPLIGTRSFAERRGGSLFIPLADVAARLGATASVDALARRVTIQRATGITSSWDARTGEVTEDHAVILVATRLGEVLFGTGPEDMMIPAEILGPLLDVSVIAGQNDVQISTGKQTAKMVDRPNSLVDINRVDYAYHLSVINLTLNHTLQLSSAGRVGDGLFDVSTNFSRSPGDAIAEFRYGRAAYESRDGFRLLVGDFNPGGELQFLSAQLRGGAVSAPLVGGRVEMFAGASRSDVIHLDASGRPNLAFDTLVVGADYARAHELGKYRLVTNGGGLYVNGPDREGGLLTGRLGYRSDLNQAQLDLGLGAFNGLQADGKKVSGVAEVIDITDSFTPTRRLTLLGRVTHIGPNFISTQQTGTLRPMNLFATGGYFRPLDWIGASLNGQLLFNPELTQLQDASVTATVSVTPQGEWPSVLISHSQGVHPAIGQTAFTLVDVSKQFKIWGMEAIYSRTATDRTPENHLFSVGGRVNVTENFRVQLLQSFSSSDSQSGSVDLVASRIFTDRLSGSIGAGYSHSPAGFNFLGRVSATALLPFNQLLTVSFNMSTAGPQLLVDLRGPLWTGGGNSQRGNSPAEQLELAGALNGRVYQDVDADGKFDPKVDAPQPDVRVLVDGSYFAVTDRNGQFEIRQLKAGEHGVLLELSSIRADLTILGDPMMKLNLAKGRDAVIEYRLVRTGRIRGAVFLDTNGNGVRDEGDESVSDVRVLTGSGKDTLTDTGGEFVIGDLPLGKHTVLLDEKTLGDEFELVSPPLQVEVHPGEEVGGVEFLVKRHERPVEILDFPPATK